jgi:transposase
MAYFVGLDVSVKETSVCVVDDSGKVISEQKVLTEPDNIITLLTSIGETYARIGIEAGPLSQWLVKALIAAGLPVIMHRRNARKTRRPYRCLTFYLEREKMKYPDLEPG